MAPPPVSNVHSGAPVFALSAWKVPSVDPKYRTPPTTAGWLLPIVLVTLGSWYAHLSLSWLAVRGLTRYSPDAYREPSSPLFQLSQLPALVEVSALADETAVAANTSTASD